MKVRQHRPSGRIVIIFIYLMIVSGFGMLAVELWKLQVKEQDGFEKVSKDQSIRRVRLPAIRGKIFDTKNRCLADSIPNYCIAIYTHELRAPRSDVANTLELIHEIWSRIGIEPDICYEDVKRHLTLTPNQPLCIYNNLSEDKIIDWRKQFEKWTAPPRGSFRRNRIIGLKLGYPVENNGIYIQTSELIRKRTSTAANTLELIYKISDKIDLDISISFQDIKDHIYARRPLPLIAWKNIDEPSIAKWANYCSSFAGSDIICFPDRTYNNGENTAHLIGYTMLAEANNDPIPSGRIHYDIRGLSGRKGIENIYNDLLSGENGYQLLQIDAAGFHNQELQTIKPKAGGNLYLTIDLEIQKMCNDILSMKQKGEAEKNVKGAIVILDPNNGNVLAMTSSPLFDPNLYMASSIYRQTLMNDPDSSTFNRAVYGQYPPGSTFKPITALSALKTNIQYADKEYDCIQGYRVDNRQMRCWIHSQGGQHGLLNLNDAIMKSCNIWMYEVAQEIGYGPIYETAKQFGIGQYAGLFPDLENLKYHPNDSYGNLPDKINNNIDLCNISIGQGRLLTSPLQMAMVTAAIANNGILYRPRLINKFQENSDAEYINNPIVVNSKLDISENAIKIIQLAMKDVVMSDEGTATKARVKNIKIAGKTGSAQYKQKNGDKITNHVYAWMISYAPFDSPKYAIAMIVEDGVSGGETIAPRLAKLYQRLFEYDGTIKRGWR